MNARHPNTKRQKNALQSLFTQAGAAFEKRDDESACRALEKVLKLEPDHLAATKTLAAIRTAMGHDEVASKLLAKAVLAEPQDPTNFLNFGVCLHRLGQLDEALACFDEALALKPDYTAALSNKGAVYRDKNEFTKALACYQKVIEMDKFRLDDYLNYALILSDLDHDEEALEVCDIALQLGARDYHGHFQKGFIQAKLMRSEQAMRSYLKSLELKPDFAEAKWNLSHIYLRRGDYQQGWKLFESRWETRNTKLHARKFSQPRWRGDFSLEGKTILIHTEQGMGDTIQFGRYALLLEKVGANVVLEVQKPLAAAMQSMSPNIKIAIEGENLPHFDCYCPQISLPFLLGTTLETVPVPGAYIFADETKASNWQRKLGAKTKTRVGLVWSGGFHKDRPETWTWNQRRNLPLEKLKLLKDLPFEFFSLQKGQPAESELAALAQEGWDGPQIIDYTADLSDFSETAALIQNLDLVISVDTSTAHLAGAMGKPVWLLNRFDCCWRWLEGASSSPWYPSMKIFNQPAQGDWDSVLSQLLEELNSLKL